MIRPAQADLYAVIGNPVRHSLSPVMMNAAFRSLKIQAVYLAFQSDSLAEDLEVFGKMGFRGLSVTLPHKEVAFRQAQEVDETAASIGAVNTLLRQQDHWSGRNTDWLGANRALQQVTSLQNRHALVIGAGGVARAVVYGLKREGAMVSVANRTRERGESLAAAFQCDFISLADLNQMQPDPPFDVIVQCTSAGLRGTKAQCIVPSSLFQPRMVVMDTVYRPLWTPFLRAALKAGCSVISGMEMLLYQGVAQLEWWLGRPLPYKDGVQIMRDALTKALAHEQNDQED